MASRAHVHLPSPVGCAKRPYCRRRSHWELGHSRGGGYSTPTIDFSSTISQHHSGLFCRDRGSLPCGMTRHWTPSFTAHYKSYGISTSTVLNTITRLTLEEHEHVQDRAITRCADDSLLLSLRLLQSPHISPHRVAEIQTRKSSLATCPSS
jgi:hypothetical protein